MVEDKIVERETLKDSKVGYLEEESLLGVGRGL